MNPFSWHSISSHRCGPAGYQSAVLEGYVPVAWVHNNEIAQSIAIAAQHCFDEASRIAHRRRMGRREKKRPPACGFFADLLAEEFFRAINDRYEQEANSRWVVPPRWRVRNYSRDAPDEFPFAVMESDQVVAWVVNLAAAGFISRAGRKAFVDREEARRKAVAASRSLGSFLAEVPG